MQCRCIKGLCPFFFFQQLLLYEKLIAMQEPIDNDPREILTRTEQLMMIEKEELIKHILRLEGEYYDILYGEDEELPW